MESQIATHNDADIILKLYDLRREALLRKARQWLISEFNPKTAEEFMALVRAIPPRRTLISARSSVIGKWQPHW